MVLKFWYIDTVDQIEVNIVIDKFHFDVAYTDIFISFCIHKKTLQ